MKWRGLTRSLWRLRKVDNDLNRRLFLGQDVWSKRQFEAVRFSSELFCLAELRYSAVYGFALLVTAEKL